MNIKFFGSEECVECQVSRFFLDSYAVPYEYRDVSGDQLVAQELRKLASRAGREGVIQLPAVVVDDLFLCDPTDDELARAMGIS